MTSTAAPGPGAAATPARRPVLIVDHDDTSPPGLVTRWLDVRGIAWEMPARGAVPAAARDWAAIVSLGWTDSANSESKEVADELTLLEDALACDVPVLGLCFGSQLLARALGGSVAPRWPGEFGWVRPTGADDSPITTLPWFCWHDDAFELPPNSAIEVLAETELCAQAYRAGRHIGFQFHPELDAATLASWMEQRASGEHPEVDLAAIAAQTRLLLPGLEDRAFALFDWWWAQAAIGVGA